MSKPKAPPTPDYAAAAQQQGQSNLESALASGHISNPNVINPYGQQTVTWNGNDPTVTQTLSPEQQAIFNAQNQNQLGLGNLASQGINNASGVLGSSFNPDLPQAPINPGTTAQEAMLSRLEPQISQDREANASSLANQGIMQGSQAYDNAMRTQGQRENDLRLQAAAQGIPMDMQARQQSLQEQTALRELPLNEISALMSGSQVSSPNFQQFQGSQVTPSPIFGAAQAQNQASYDAYNAKMGGYNNMMSGLFSLGASAMPKFG